MRLETTGTSPDHFQLAAAGEQVTLLLRDRNLVITNGSVSQALGVMLGLPLSASDLERLLACPTGPGPTDSPFVERHAHGWRRELRVGANGWMEAWGRQDLRSGAWTLVMIRRAKDGNGWRADFSAQRDGFWRRIRLASIDWAGQTGQVYDVKLAIDDLQVDPLLERDAYSFLVPASARPITIDELEKTNVLRRNRAP